MHLEERHCAWIFAFIKARCFKSHREVSAQNFSKRVPMFGEKTAKQLNGVGRDLQRTGGKKLKTDARKQEASGTHLKKLILRPLYAPLFHLTDVQDIFGGQRPQGATPQTWIGD